MSDDNDQGNIVPPTPASGNRRSRHPHHINDAVRRHPHQRLP